MGLPVSRWLSPSNLDLDLAENSPALNHVKDGVLDISVEVMGADKAQYKPWPAFLHLQRGKPLSALVPVMAGDALMSTPNWIPIATRVDRADRLTVVKGVCTWIAAATHKGVLHAASSNCSVLLQHSR